jgi:hypothetical protein
MSKAKMSWVTGERPASSSKQNQQTVDHITPGLPIWSISMDVFWDTTLTPATQAIGNVRHGWYPFNGSKSVFDRLYLIGREVTDGTETTDELEVSFDGGANWQDAFPSAAAAPVDFYASAGTLVEIHDISGIAGFQWIGIRRSSDAPNAFAASYRLKILGLLYLSTDTPF